MARGTRIPFRSGQPTAQAESRTIAARHPLEKEADPLSFLVSLLTETNASERVGGTGKRRNVTDTARASAPA